MSTGYGDCQAGCDEGLFESLGVPEYFSLEAALIWAGSYAGS